MQGQKAILILNDLEKSHKATGNRLQGTPKSTTNPEPRTFTSCCYVATTRINTASGYQLLAAKTKPKPHPNNRGFTGKPGHRQQATGYREPQNQQQTRNPEPLRAAERLNIQLSKIDTASRLPLGARLESTRPREVPSAPSLIPE